MKADMLIVHGGAPTAVMNASLYGAIKAAQESGEVGRILGARGGSRAILRGDFLDLSALDEETLELLPSTPASYIGTSRDPIEKEEYARIVDILLEKHIRYVLFNGGNGSMDSCGKLAHAAAQNPRARDLRIIGIPKTIDNDIAVTDHAPGFGSAARYLAASVAELARDVASLPIHVCIVESMGRNAGWLTAASALAAFQTASGCPGQSSPPLGPHLIYVPEIPFDEERFLDEAKTLYDRMGGVLVVASEGLKNREGAPIVPPVFQVGRSVYYGDVSAYLCALVIRKLGIKARSEKPGILGRCSIAHQSPLDKEEAIRAGEAAVQATLSGQSAAMIGFRRLSSEPYRAETILVPIEEVMLHERKLPLEYVDTENNGIRASFLDWCRPLIGGQLTPFAIPVGPV